MIQVISPNLWVGNSHDEQCAELADLGIGAVLNVARDMQLSRQWGAKSMECMQVGLVDGPGNPLTAYCAAVLALASLVDRHGTLVCCHTGSRSLAVAVMYARFVGDCEWDAYLEFLRERVDADVPAPHPAHRKAFDTIDWKILRVIMEAR